MAMGYYRIHSSDGLKFRLQSGEEITIGRMESIVASRDVATELFQAYPALEVVDATDEEFALYQKKSDAKAKEMKKAEEARLKAEAAALKAEEKKTEAKIEARQKQEKADRKKSTSASEAVIQNELDSIKSVGKGYADDTHQKEKVTKQRAKK